MLIFALVSSVAASAGGTYWFVQRQGRSSEVQAEEAAVVHGGKIPSANTVFFALDPPFVVNFELPSPVRFLQVTVELELRSAADQDAVQKHLPVIRNNLLLLFSSQDYTDLRTREGKERLRVAVLEELNAILQERVGHAGVTQVYFTHFVMQ